MTLPPNIPSLTLKGFKWLILRFLYPGKRASVLGTISNKITLNEEPFNFLEYLDIEHNRWLSALK